jgi:peptidoglycan/LPS O-acetylase OafA/YrhL
MPALDGLRGVAVLIVVWHNVLGFAAPTAASTILTKAYFVGARAGWVGVSLFFVLSGFLITGILLDTRGARRALPTFVARRALRIFPLYYATLLFFFVVLPTLHALPSWLEMDYANQLWFWTYLTNWTTPFGHGGFGLSHFWSLAVEEQFYLLWPLTVLHVRTPRVVAASLLLILIAVISRIVIGVSSLPADMIQGALYFFTTSRCDALALGALIALAARHRMWAPRLRLAARIGMVVAGLALLVITIIRHTFGQNDVLVATVGQSFVAALFGGLVAWGMHPVIGAPRWFTALLESRALRAVGKYSYAIYVIHFPITQGVMRAIPKSVLAPETPRDLLFPTAVAIGIFAVTYCAALISWSVLERPCLNLRRFIPSPDREAHGAP